MRALTIEQIKQLKDGDWVYLVDMIDRHYSDYYKIGHTQDDMKLYFVGIYIDTDYGFDEYGKKWLAYRNKEEAECEGELVELPCKLGDMVYFYDFRNKKIFQGKVVGIRLNYYTQSNPIWVRIQYDIPMVVNNCEKEVFASMVFTNKEKAEQKLKELPDANH